MNLDSFFNVCRIKQFTLGYGKCSGGKKFKIRLTRMATAVALNERLEMLVIETSTSPSCFKNIKSLQYCHQHQKKSRMTGKLFEEWVKDLDRALDLDLCFWWTTVLPTLLLLKVWLRSFYQQVQYLYSNLESRSDQEYKGPLSEKSC